MSWFEAARARARLFLRRSADARVEEEFGFHIAMETDRLVREERLDPDEARRRALIAFGGIEKHKETLRDDRGFAWFSGLSLDFRLAVRMLAKYPGLTLVGTLALAIAIAGGTSYLEAVNDIYRPTLRNDRDHRIVRLMVWDVGKNEADPRVVQDFEVWRSTLTSVEMLGALRPFEHNLITHAGRIEPIRGVEISASAFGLFPVAPLLGRPLLDADERPGAPPVVVIGERNWQQLFDGDSAIIGQTVRIGTELVTIVGVMPADFGFPVNQGIWLPLRLDPSASARTPGLTLSVFGRLAPGATREQAQAELSTIGRRLAVSDPVRRRNLRPRVVPFVESLVAQSGDDLFEMRVLYGLNLFFLALLGICGANVATLVFARTATRETELAVRTALGASRRRLVMQLFAEALVLCGMAAMVGLSAAALGLRWARRVLETAVGQQVPFWWNDALAPATIVYATALAVLAAAMVGIVPALKATGRELGTGLKRAGTGSGLRFGRSWTAVIVGQVALTAIFLLVVVSITWSVRVGRYGQGTVSLPTEHYLTAQLQMDGAPRDPSSEGGRAFRERFDARYREIARRLAAQPGVAGVSYASRLPGMELRWTELELDGIRGSSDRPVLLVHSASLGPDFLGTFGAPVLRGRAFTAADLAFDRHVVIVDRTFQRRLLGDRNPIGQKFRVVRESGNGTIAPWNEIIGVIDDLTQLQYESDANGTFYRPATPGAAYPPYLLVHASGDPRQVAPLLRQVAAEVDLGLRLYEVEPMSENGWAGRLVFSALMRVVAVVGAIALLLSTAGVYALISFTVARRTREIGIRSALGADRRRIVTETFSRAFAQVGAGVGTGAVLGGLLVAIGPPEAGVGAGATAGVVAASAVAGFIVIVGLLSCIGPMRRALRIQPTEALRAAD